MAIDIPRRQIKAQRKSGRTECASPNAQLRTLAELYAFMARRTESKFNKAVSHRLILSKRNKAPMNLARLAELMKNQKDRIAAIVGTVTNDIKLEAFPKMTIAALRFTSTARARIEAAGGEAITFDQLLVRSPKGNGVILLRGHTKSREAEKHFGRAPGLPGSHTKPYACPKYSH